MYWVSELADSENDVDVSVKVDVPAVGVTEVETRLAAPSVSVEAA